MHVSQIMNSSAGVRFALVGLLVVAVLILNSVIGGSWGDIGPDSDDVMRLVQVKDLLNGQGWFDVSQARLGPDGGTAMHWSRLADLPIVMLAGLFDVFMPSETALIWAYSVWPPLSVLLVLGGLYMGARHMAGEKAGLACLVLSAFIYATHYRFFPGAIDHHNLQLGLLAVALGLILDPERRAGRMAGAGLALAGSVAIGGEVYLFVAILCAFVALDWAITGPDARRGAIGLGAGLAAGLELAFFSTIAPSNYQMVACDALSSITLLAGMAGGLGLVAAAVLTSARDWRIRLCALGIVGGVCAAVLFMVGPQCLSNPLSDLSPTVKELWLDRISEARPVLSSSPAALGQIPYRLGIALIALGLCLLGLHRRRMIRANLLCAVLLGAALIMTLYQIRFFVFGHLFAVIPLGLWLWETYRDGKARDERSVGYLGALAVSLPILWGLPGVLLMPDTEQAHMADGKEVCTADSLFEALNTLPQGRILASSDFGPPILNTTRHSVLQANYHRNEAGISQAIMLLLSHEGETEGLLAASGVDYVITCPGDPESLQMAEHDPDGLAARLKRGDVPEFLREGPSLSDPENPAMIYSVVSGSIAETEDEGIS